MLKKENISITISTKNKQTTYHQITLKNTKLTRRALIRQLQEADGGSSATQTLTSLNDICESYKYYY